jgi:hypothetical protein
MAGVAGVCRLSCGSSALRVWRVSNDSSGRGPVRPWTLPGRKAPSADFGPGSRTHRWVVGRTSERTRARGPSRSDRSSRGALEHIAGRRLGSRPWGMASGWGPGLGLGRSSSDIPARWDGSAGNSPSESSRLSEEAGAVGQWSPNGTSRLAPIRQVSALHRSPSGRGGVVLVSLPFCGPERQDSWRPRVRRGRWFVRGYPGSGTCSRRKLVGPKLLEESAPSLWPFSPTGSFRAACGAACRNGAGPDISPGDWRSDRDGHALGRRLPDVCRTTSLFDQGLLDAGCRLGGAVVAAMSRSWQCPGNRCGGDAGDRTSVGR